MSVAVNKKGMYVHLGHNDWAYPESPSLQTLNPFENEGNASGGSEMEQAESGKAGSYRPGYFCVFGGNAHAPGNATGIHSVGVVLSGLHKRRGDHVRE